MCIQQPSTTIINSMDFDVVAVGIMHILLLYMYMVGPSAFEEGVA